MNVPTFDTEGDESRISEMIERIRQLEREAKPGELPPDVVLQLSAMKEDICSLQAEMDAIKNDVSDAMRMIQRETQDMLGRVAQMEHLERPPEELLRELEAVEQTKQNEK
jgi:hypothetical protein